MHFYTDERIHVSHIFALKEMLKWSTEPVIFFIHNICISMAGPSCAVATYSPQISVTWKNRAFSLNSSMCPSWVSRWLCIICILTLRLRWWTFHPFLCQILKAQGKWGLRVSHQQQKAWLKIIHFLSCNLTRIGHMAPPNKRGARDWNAPMCPTGERWNILWG